MLCLGVQCVASELVTSKSFNVGYTMRGPRMKSVRYDKVGLPLDFEWPRL